MAEPGLPHRWTGRLLFFLVSISTIVAAILPIHSSRSSAEEALGSGLLAVDTISFSYPITATGIFFPDVMLVLTFVFALRRPDMVPFWLIGLVFFLADVVLLRPLGLWTILVIISVEFLRRRARQPRKGNLYSEWMTASAAIAGVFLINTLILSFALVPQAQFSLVLIKAGLSILAYPLFATVMELIFRLKPIPLTDRERYSNRL